MAGVRDKVTDLIFRARVVGADASRAAPTSETAAVHEDAGGYGVAEELAATGRAIGASPRRNAARLDQARARRQGQDRSSAKRPRSAATILCPCGSGKKYKKCHGAGVGVKFESSARPQAASAAVFLECSKTCNVLQARSNETRWLVPES